MHSIEQLVKLLLRTPTGDNCQPFSFTFNKDLNTLEIYHNSNLAKHNLNPENLSSLISFGAMLDLFKAAQDWGNFQAEIQYNLEAFYENGPIVKIANIVFKNTDFKIPEALISDLEKIKTPRQIPNKSATTHLDFDLQGFSNIFSVRKISQAQIDRTLIDQLAILDASIWENESIISDTFFWVKGPIASLKSYSEGMSFQDIGMNFFEALVIPLIKSPLVRPLAIFRKIIARIGKVKFKKTLKNSYGLIVICGNINSKDQLLELGRTFSKLRRKLKTEKLSMQPLSIASFPLVFNSLIHQDANSLENFKLQNELQKSLLEKLKLPKDQKVLWIFRVTKYDSKLNRTPRRPVAEVLTAELTNNGEK